MRVYPSRVSLPEDARAAVCDYLNAWLATTADLASQAKQAHWNVKGPLFYPLHLLFDTVYTSANGFIDTIAERITALGGIARGTVRMAADASPLPEFPDALDSLAAVAELADRVAIWTNQARSGIDHALSLRDQGTADLCIEVVREADKLLWFLESHLQLAAGTP